MEAAGHTILLLTGRPSSLRRERRAEGGAVLFRELRRCECVVLRAAHRDLDGAHERGDTPRGFPIETAKDAVNQAGAIGVAAPGRIEHFPGLGAGNLVCLAIGMNDRALTPT